MSNTFREWFSACAKWAPERSRKSLVLKYFRKFPIRAYSGLIILMVEKFELTMSPLCILVLNHRLPFPRHGATTNFLFWVFFSFREMLTRPVYLLQRKKQFETIQETIKVWGSFFITCRLSLVSYLNRSTCHSVVCKASFFVSDARCPQINITRPFEKGILAWDAGFWR